MEIKALIVSQLPQQHTTESQNELAWKGPKVIDVICIMIININNQAKYE